MESVFQNYSNPFLAALVVGLGCGTGCSPVISVFLSAYVVGTTNSIKRSLALFLNFVFGKMFIVVALGMISSIIGSAIIGKNGKLFGLQTIYILDIFMVLTGLAVLFMHVFKNENECNCNGGCAKKEKKLREKTYFSAFLVGVGYGLTPCAPLLMILVFSSLMKTSNAVLLTSTFAIASSISPLILLVVFMGFLSKKMYSEIPHSIGIFKLIASAVLIITGIVSFLGHISL